MEIFWRKFKAMGTEIVISAYLERGQEDILEKAEKEISEFEKNFSRFVVGNELYKFNNIEESEFKASETMIELIKISQRYYENTGGIFDPTIIKNLEAVGYDRNYTDITDEKNAKDGEAPESIKSIDRPDLREVKIEGDIVTKSKGLKLDFGGIGKGYIVDRLSNNLLKDVENFWISAGGDISVRGSDIGKSETGWKIGVQNPHRPENEIFSIDTAGKSLGVATSGIFRRKGEKNGFKWHHIIDPRTGLPVDNDISAVSVVTKSAMDGDVYAKTVLILGRKNGIDFIDSLPDTECIIFHKDGRINFSANAFNYFKV